MPLFEPAVNAVEMLSRELPTDAAKGLRRAEASLIFAANRSICLSWPKWLARVSRRAISAPNSSKFAIVLRVHESPALMMKPQSV